jgi:tetratricopeptide (TPR) repeat protein
MTRVHSFAAYAAIAVTFTFLIGMPINSFAADVGSQLTEAEKLLEKKEYEQAIAILEPMLEEGAEGVGNASVHFMLGRVLYENSFAAISANRVDGKVKMKDIAPPQVTELKAAAEQFLKVVEIDSAGDLVPDAYFMLGKVWDYDCLQKFGKSKKAYDKVAEMKPDTQMSKDATSCVERLDGYFNSHGSSH